MTKERVLEILDQQLIHIKDSIHDPIVRVFMTTGVEEIKRQILNDPTEYSKGYLRYRAECIAIKYVHGHHDALTDNQEKKDMTEDIMKFGEEYHKTMLHIESENNKVYGTSNH